MSIINLSHKLIRLKLWRCHCEIGTNNNELEVHMQAFCFDNAVESDISYLFKMKNIRIQMTVYSDRCRLFFRLHYCYKA